MPPAAPPPMPLPRRATLPPAYAMMIAAFDTAASAARCRWRDVAARALPTLLRRAARFAMHARRAAAAAAITPFFSRCLRCARRRARPCCRDTAQLRAARYSRAEAARMPPPCAALLMKRGRDASAADAAAHASYLPRCCRHGLRRLLYAAAADTPLFHADCCQLRFSPCRRHCFFTPLHCRCRTYFVFFH